MIVRPLTEHDVEAVADVAQAALPIPAEFDDGSRRDWIAGRTRHLLATDPDGSWVAELEGAVVGVALALVRDGIWGLSLLAVAPDLHARGAGSKLLTASLQHAEGARGALIASSEDPRAMRIYARAGFDLHPCVALAGIANREALPADLRCRPSDDVEQAAAVSKQVRGGAYGLDDLAMLAGQPGHGLLLVEGRGFAIHRTEGSPAVLCATDDEAARDLFLGCVAAGPNGSSIHVDLITAGQDWVIQAGLALGLPLSGEGPMFTRGELGPLRPWLPSGSFL